jgi:hypothetical protein
MKNKNLVLPKILGTFTISAVLIIGVYVLIIDLPKIKNESSEQISSATQSSSNILEETTSTSKPDTNTPEQPTPTESNSSVNGTTSPPSNPTTPSTPTTPNTPTTPTTPSYTYNNGSFTTTASYGVPGGNTNTLTATITINNDIITTLTTSQFNLATSQEYYDNFKAEISGSVNNNKLVGLLIPDGPGDAVGGASLTSTAFNQILNQIRNTAKK